MPTYEYECRGCGHRFERFQRISDKPVRSCPECGKRRVRRLISSGGGLVFKGPGFYATDYRSDRGRPSSESESGGDSPKKEEKEKDPKKIGSPKGEGDA